MGYFDFVPVTISQVSLVISGEVTIPHTQKDYCLALWLVGLATAVRLRIEQAWRLPQRVQQLEGNKREAPHPARFCTNI